jgi:PAS domain S-box-containing protein
MRPRLLPSIVLGLGLAAGLVGIAQADGHLDAWRSEADSIKLLILNDVPQAKVETLRLQAALPADAEPADRIRILNLLARCEAYLAETEAAAKRLDEAHALARRHGDKIGQVEANLTIMLNAVSEGRLDKMRQASAETLPLLDGIDRPALLAEAMQRTTMLYFRHNQLAAALTISLQNEDIARRSGDPLAQTWAHHGLAIAYDQSGAHEKSREHFRQTLEFARAAGSRNHEAFALNGLALSSANMGETQEAEKFSREAIELIRATGMPFALNHFRYGLATILRKQGRLPETIATLDEVAAGYRRHPNRVGLWWTLNTRAGDLLAQGKLDAAERDAVEAQAIGRAVDFPIYIAESGKRLAAIAAARGDYRSAHAHRAQADDAAKKAENQKASEITLATAERFQTEARQREIDQLTRRNEQQAAKERWLWTVFAASLALLALSAFFLLHQRRSNQQLAMLNLQLRQSGNKLQATLDAIPDLLFEVGLDGRYYDYHSPRTDLLVVPATEFLGRTVAEMLPHQAAESCLEALSEAHETGASMGRKIFLELPDGPRWFELSVARKNTVAGREPRFIVLSRDITERQCIESALVASEQEFRTLAENTPDNICRYDLQGRMSYVNPRKEAMAGMAAEQLLGKTVPEAFPDGEKTDCYQQRLQSVIATGEENEIEIELPDRSRGIRHHHIRFVAERDAECQIVGVLAIGRDITELREKERQIEESRDLLRELAEYRDSAREEERKRIAREIHDELGQLLTAQRLDIATLKFQFGMDNPALGERCRHLLEVTDQTIRSVRSIASALRPAALDMGITLALEWLADEFGKRTGVDCRLHLGQVDMELDEDLAVAVFRIVQESLTNVARYAEARQVDISLENCDDRYHLSIRDNGRGFDPEGKRPRSFGLLGIRERALMLSGEANIISAPGRGTCVEVTIPDNRKIKATS